MEIIKGKLESIYPLGGYVYGKVATEDKKNVRVKLSNKAMWALLRQHFSYKINREFKESKEEFRDFAIDRLSKLKRTEKMQFIVDEKRDFAIAVASLKHSIKNEDYVYDLIGRILQKKKFNAIEEKGISGKVVYLKSHPAFNVGLQIYGGDITTSRAITITPFAKINSCLNPLSWLGIEKMWYSQKETLEIISIRRLEKSTNIEERITTLMTKSMKIVRKVNSMLRQGKKVEVTEIEAKKLLLVMCKSYGIGLKAINIVYKKWKTTEEKTLYGLAMACSYYSSHENIFKKTSLVSKQNISSIAGALLLIKKEKIMKIIVKKMKDSKELRDEFEEIEDE